MRSFIALALCASAHADSYTLPYEGSLPGDTTVGHTFVTPAGSYAPPGTSVNSHLQVSRDVGELKTTLKASPWDKEATLNVYQNGVHTTASGKMLQNRAAKDLTGYLSPMYNTFNTFYGATDWMDQWIMSAMEGTGDFASADIIDDAKKEAIEKGCMDQVLTMMTVVEMETAIYKKIPEEAGGAGGAVHNWDEAFAYYVGGVGGTSFYSPYGRADKRCGNYNTCDADGTSAVNKKVLAALADGAAALFPTFDTAAATAAMETIKAQMAVIYIQATMRYLWKMDNAVRLGKEHQEYQAEGWAFWRVIEPIYGADGSVITDMYKLTATAPTATTHFCTGHNFLMARLPNGVTAADIGTLEHVDISAGGIACPCDSEDMTCGHTAETMEAEQEEETTVTASSSSSADEDDDKDAAPSASFGKLLFGLLATALLPVFM